MKPSQTFYAFLSQFVDMSNVDIGKKLIESSRILALMKLDSKQYNDSKSKTIPAHNQIFKKQLEFQQAWVTFLHFQKFQHHPDGTCLKKSTQKHTLPKFLFQIKRAHPKDVKESCKAYDEMMSAMKTNR